jgi:acylphosphatase
MKVCKRVHYAGTVQGVGFRYTTWNVAKHYNVTGDVKTLAGGDVELVAQGEAEEVERFLRGVANQMAEYIREQRVADIPAAEFDSFDIRH